MSSFSNRAEHRGILTLKIDAGVRLLSPDLALHPSSERQNQFLQPRAGGAGLGPRGGGGCQRNLPLEMSALRLGRNRPSGVWNWEELSMGTCSEPPGRPRVLVWGTFPVVCLSGQSLSLYSSKQTTLRVGKQVHRLRVPKDPGTQCGLTGHLGSPLGPPCRQDKGGKFPEPASRGCTPLFPAPQHLQLFPQHLLHPSTCCSVSPLKTPQQCRNRSALTSTALSLLSEKAVKWAGLVAHR